MSSQEKISDTLKSFKFLRENIPTWLQNLADVEKKIQEKACEMAVVPVHLTPVKKKTGSTESLKPNEDDEDKMRPEAITSPLFDTTQSALRQQMAQTARRKRKTASVLSAASGPNKYRTKTMIIIYYDSEIQKYFETLVRNIGTGRNLLRRGKMAAKMEAMAEAAELDDDNDNDDDFTPSKLGYQPKLGFRRTGGGAGGLPSIPQTNTEAYDSSDKTLETAQSLCERGAHQVLRDGDCTHEINGARKAFEEVLKISEQQEKILQQKEDMKSQVSLPAPEIKIPIKSVIPAVPVIPVAHPFIPAKATGPIEIEVDDDGEEEEDFIPLPPIRTTRR
ncbi:hypothetical protein M501DRAFT_830177 [Patellaria atrata CBS 101060]|uniref:Uncharacterized protein n=1 Tax=Patellaria atrata CBS 101060 TaxID=1346257 RepID=A0A9P4SA09_9PEZI|nr:hypothetical protein M501DRAFT_830177 [Patellaria atrata CBS 101060]